MQQRNRFISGARRIYQHYDRLMEKQGFTIVLITCVMVIVLSALYTFHFREAWNTDSGTDLPEEMISAVDAQSAQTLHDAQELIRSQNTAAASVPTEAPFRFAQPVAGFLVRDFSMKEPQYFPKANYWRLHPAIDLQAEYGTSVTACSDGRVLRVWQDQELGLCIRLSHSHGYETVYAGLSDASYIKQGDPVFQGQTIGHLGNGVLAESDAQPHLHFEVWKGSTAIDPIELILGIDLTNAR